jgi:2-polyprenyl-3-methyl-5-hydroxy-6-metoxy-1,4-benzoquinol methylase
LDVGCAYGFLVAEADRLGFDAYGADVSEYAISQAKKLFPHLTDRFFVSDCLSLLGVFGEQSFDVISMFELVEHLENPRKALAIVNGVLKPRGLLLITTPDPKRVLKDVDVTHRNVRDIAYWKRTLLESGFSVEFPCLMYDTRMHGARFVRLLTRNSTIRRGYSYVKARWLTREPSYHILAVKK